MANLYTDMTTIPVLKTGFVSQDTSMSIVVQDERVSRLTVAQLTLSRGDRCLVENLSFELPTGRALQITGPNGCGKTTLLRTLAGLTLPETGSITWVAGTEALDKAPRLAYLGHRNALKADLTPREELAFSLRLHGIHNLDRIATCLNKLGLTHCAELHCGQLSAGQQRRVALARVLVSDCPVWILDEPLTALDTQACDGFQVMLSQHLRQGGLAFIATHQSLTLDAGSLVTLALEATC